jgi:succinyl-diaminopimelate desuccinylase
MKEDFDKVSKKIDFYEKEMINTMRRMIEIKAISPLSGGRGESERAEFLERTLKEWGFATKRYDYRDTTGTLRPNITTVMPGNNGERTVWVVAHMDTVSEGDISLWKTDPFNLTVKDGRLYGRGTLDNGQEVIAGMFALRALKETGMKLRYNMGLALVADEELGSRYGIEPLLKENIFTKNDMYVVPDWGNKKGDRIEVAEKGLLWLKITVLGKQVHASTPANGVNAYRHAIRFLSRVDQVLHSKYNASNEIFVPKTSTFEMTKHEKNVDSVNIVPGREVSYIDCRVLPQYDLDEVINDVNEVAREKEFEEVKIVVEVFNREDAAPQTEENAEVVQMLKTALLDLRKIKAPLLGIGGGTCAAFFRKKGFSAAAWSTEDRVEHEPDEYALVENMLNDAKVLAYLPI